MSDAPTLTHALRGLVWGIQCELDVVHGLSRQIDGHVRALNVARAELAERLLRLDALLAAADDPRLEAFVRARAVVRLPVEDEVLSPLLGAGRSRPGRGRADPPRSRRQPP